ncbi:serine hydrolase [Sphingobacterium sp. SYP-B4668]|uniref:serine hydrolase n=1 Tax=Sphingobacterium sp. SYP-B4668 TaxID=2996035 RepID=UPI0022DD46CA|nr:serine hydrolase [Sphingobacterium sp. SYP-B4668]
MKTYLTLVLLGFLSISIPTLAQKNDDKLTKKLTEAIAEFKGEVGIYVKKINSDKEVAIHADEIFPTASIVKVPILVGLFDKINNGELKYKQKFIYRKDRIYGGSGLMQFFKDSVETDLATMASLMISYSDNITSIWCQELAEGTKINNIMDKLGLKNTKVNSRTPGREAAWKEYGWGNTTPREMASLLIMIREGQVISPSISDKMYRVLGNVFYNERSLSQVPAHIKTASKSGSLDDVRSEVVLVNAPSGDYVFSIFTKNNLDRSWEQTNEAENLTRRISNLLWNYFEPKHPFPFQSLLN